MDPRLEHRLLITRRHFFGLNAAGLGTAALSVLLGRELATADATVQAATRSSKGGLPGVPHFKPKAKRVIWLFQSGGPSQMELFDYKPTLENIRGSDLPDSIRKGQRLTGMTATQDKFPVVPSIFKFARHGESGAWLSELLPHTAAISDELCFIRSMHTEAINHDPAITFFQTGAQIAGRPSIGAWLAYGLGSETEVLPAFVVLITQGGGDQPLYDRLWGSGFLPTQYQGVKFRSVGDPVLYLSDPPGFTTQDRSRYLESLSKLNEIKLGEFGDPEIATRIAQYEMAFRMQSSVPELTDLSSEPDRVFELYGEDARKPGTFAANCLLARRLAERGVRFIQLFHRGWDQHGKLPRDLAKQCQATDQASAALVQDLKARGMLDETLIVWGGEFGRTVYCQGRLTEDDYGRDHHPRCFTMWLAGGGFKPGMIYGQTDDFSYNITRDPVHVHDLHATILHCLGIDHTKLTFKYQGRHFRLTDVHGEVVEKVLS
ncbi:MAG: DUF1501 domain-containing protein [Acidobacteriota bacterium]